MGEVNQDSHEGRKQFVLDNQEMHFRLAQRFAYDLSEHFHGAEKQMVSDLSIRFFQQAIEAGAHEERVALFNFMLNRMGESRTRVQDL